MRLPSIKTLTLIASVLTLTTGCAAFEPCKTPACENDRRISAEVLWQLNTRASFQPNSIRVQTYDGEVYLYGMVDTDFERTLAADIARIPGVRDVHNELTINNPIF